MTERQRTTWTSGGLGLGVLLALGLLVVLPLMLLLADALPQQPGEFDAWRARLAEPTLQQALLYSIGVALLACGLASLLAVPLALLVVRVLPGARWPASLLGLLPLAMPPFLGAALLNSFSTLYNASGLADLFGPVDVQGSGLALSAVYALHYFPLILFCLIVGLDRVDRRFEESARNLGAGGVAVWWRIVLPLATPGFVMGAALMVLKVIEDIGAPRVLGVDTLLAPQLLLRLGEGGLGDLQLQMTALTLLGSTLIVTLLAWPALVPPAADRRPGLARRVQRGPLADLVSAPPLLGLALLTLSPLGWLMLLAFGAHGPDGLLPGVSVPSPAPEPFAGGGAAITLLYAAGTGLLVMLLGLASGGVTAIRTPLARLLRVAGTAMFAVPGVVLALGYLHLTAWWDGGPATAWVALALVVAFKQLPFAQLILAGPMRRLRSGGLDAAHGIGAHGPALYLGAAAPALAAELGAVFLLGAAAAALELSAALVLMGSTQAPYAAALFHAVRAGSAAAPWAAGAMLLVLTVALALVTILLLLRRRQGTPPHGPAHKRPPPGEDP